MRLSKEKQSKILYRWFDVYNIKIKQRGHILHKGDQESLTDI